MKTKNELTDFRDAIDAHLIGNPVEHSNDGRAWLKTFTPDWTARLYRPAPIPEPPKPWDSPDDVPGPVCFIRYVTCEETWQIIHGAGRDGIWILLGDNCNPTAHLVSYKTIGESWLYSTTRAKGSWKPCVKSV